MLNACGVLSVLGTSGSSFSIQAKVKCFMRSGFAAQHWPSNLPQILMMQILKENKSPCMRIVPTQFESVTLETGNIGDFA